MDTTIRAGSDWIRRLGCCNHVLHRGRDVLHLRSNNNQSHTQHRYLRAFPGPSPRPPFLIVCPTGTAHAPIVAATLLLAHFDGTEEGWALRSWPLLGEEEDARGNEDCNERWVSLFGETGAARRLCAVQSVQLHFIPMSSII